MKSLYKKGIEAQFKRVPEGWSFQGPRWLLSAAPPYVVNDAQKAKIIDAHPSAGLALAFFSMLALSIFASAILYSGVSVATPREPLGPWLISVLISVLISMLTSVLLFMLPTTGYYLLVALRVRCVVAERPQTWNIPLMARFSEGTLHVICIAFAIGSALLFFVNFVCAFLVVLRFIRAETYGLFIAAFCLECLALYLYALLLLKPKERRES
jgi:hypothetical protein